MDGLNFISRGNHCVIQSNVKLIKILYINVLNDISVKLRCLSRHGLTEARSLCCCHITPWKHQGGDSGLACCVYSTSTTTLATHSESGMWTFLRTSFSNFLIGSSKFWLTPYAVAELYRRIMHFLTFDYFLHSEPDSLSLLQSFTSYAVYVVSYCIFTIKTDKTDQYMHYNL